MAATLGRGGPARARSPQAPRGGQLEAPAAAGLEEDDEPFEPEPEDDEPEDDEPEDDEPELEPAADVPDGEPVVLLGESVEVPEEPSLEDEPLRLSVR